MATIFWLEDQMRWIERVQPVLERTAFDEAPAVVAVFKSAEAAFQHIRQLADGRAPDIALLDANMNSNAAAGFSVSRALHRKWPQAPLSTWQIAEKPDADPEHVSYANYCQPVRTLRHSFDTAPGGDGGFTEASKAGQDMIAFGDEGAYCWKPTHGAPS